MSPGVAPRRWTTATCAGTSPVATWNAGSSRAPPTARVRAGGPSPRSAASSGHQAMPQPSGWRGDRSANEARSAAPIASATVIGRRATWASRRHISRSRSTRASPSRCAPSGVAADALGVPRHLGALHHHDVVDQRVAERLAVERARVELVAASPERLRQQLRRPRRTGRRPRSAAASRRRSMPSRPAAMFAASHRYGFAAGSLIRFSTWRAARRRGRPGCGPARRGCRPPSRSGRARTSTGGTACSR